MRLLETEGENELNNKFGVEIDFLYLRQRHTAVVQRRDRVRMFACGRENNKRLIVFVDWSSLRPTFTHLMVTLFFWSPLAAVALWIFVCNIITISR